MKYSYKSKLNVVICIAAYYGEAPLLRCSDMAVSNGITRTAVVYLKTRTIPASTPQLHSITALYLALILPTHGRNARLSRPG